MDRGKRRRGGKDEGGREYGRGRRKGKEGKEGGGEERIGTENEQEGEASMINNLDDLNLVSNPQKYDPEKVAKRPDNGGQAGRPIPLYTNHFLMKCQKKQSFQYDVKITDAKKIPLSEEDTELIGLRIGAKFSRKIVKQCSDENNWGPDWVYDGKNTLYTPEEYPVFTRQEKTFPVQIQTDNQKKKFNVHVHVKWTATINFLDLYKYLKESGLKYPQEVIMNLEVLFRHVATRNPNCFVFGRSIYFNDQKKNETLTPGNSEIWLGYHQSVKPCQQGLCLNIDTKCAVFLKSQRVIDFLVSTGQLNSEEDLAKLDNSQYMSLNQSISRLMIETTHRVKNTKERVMKLTKESAEKLTFKDSENKTISVADYWKGAYGNLRNPNFPCLDVSKSDTKLNYLPLEVCMIVANQRQIKITDEQTKHVIRSSAVKPNIRKHNIIKTLNDSNLRNDSTVVRAYGINIDNRMMNVDGRILKSPHLEYKTPKCMNTGDHGAWNLADVVFYNGAQIKSWAVIDLTGRNMASRKGDQGLLAFINALIEMASKMGMILPKDFPPHLPGNVQNIQTFLERSNNEAKKVYNQNNTDFVLVVLPNTNSMNYQNVKRIAEGTLGIVTQCVVARNAGIGSPPRGRPQYLANLVMKINHKVGGVNTQIMTTMARCFPLLGHEENRPFIVFGADVTHPLSFNSSEKSVGAVVASMDPALGQFAARILKLEHRTEKLVGLKDAVKELLETFVSKTKYKPEAIFYYRDGISKGEVPSYMEYEYEEFQKAFEELENGYKPPITFVLAIKRHNTRFFPADSRDGDKNGNIHPGTVIDTGITSKFDFDFYLNSHAGIQGTNKSTRYQVLIDENGFSSDGMQMFTYWMCYLCCRCTRSISYVPPTYYAHLAAFHGKYLLDRTETSSTSDEGETQNLVAVSSNLNHRMYFV